MPYHTNNIKTIHILDSTNIDCPRRMRLCSCQTRNLMEAPTQKIAPINQQRFKIKKCCQGRNELWRNWNHLGKKIIVLMSQQERHDPQYTHKKGEKWFKLGFVCFLFCLNALKQFILGLIIIYLLIVF